MKELMKKLGVEDYSVDYDLVVEGQGFLEIEDLTHLEEFDISEDSEAKVYLRIQQKQIYELTENKKYMVAHGENGSDESLSVIYQNCHFGLTKDEVVAFVKKHFRDFVSSYIMIFEEDAWISVKEYISILKKEVKEVVADKDMILVSQELGIRTLKAGQGLEASGYYENSEALIFYKDDSVQINELDTNKRYTIIMLSVNGSDEQVFCGGLTQQGVLQSVNDYISDYAKKELLIFEDENCIFIQDYYKNALEQSKADDAIQRIRVVDLKGKHDKGCTCHCCGKDISQAIWRDLAMLKGNVVEVKEKVPMMDNSHDYDCDKWFDTVEDKFKELGILPLDEVLSDYEEKGFFAGAFANDAVRDLLFAVYPIKFEPGAYCLHCNASL